MKENGIEMELSKLITEQRNPVSMNLDQLSTMEMLTVINEQDKKVADAVAEVLPQIERTIEKVYEAFEKGGRLFYAGAGTSGRIGIIDASECPPTFMTDAKMVQTVMAGGNGAFFQAVEGAEDDKIQGKEDLRARGLTKNDVVIGITASGRTPYPIGAVKYASSIGAFTASLTCNANSLISQHTDCGIEVIVGPEVLTGSTRMKAATAHKMVLNMISTVTMVKLGKVYENLMVDLHASNYKLNERAKSIIMEITSVSYERAGEVLEKTSNEVKPAIVMIEAGVQYEAAIKALNACKGYVRKAIEYLS